MTSQIVYEAGQVIAKSSVAITDIRGIEHRLILSDFKITPGFVIHVLETAKRLRERGRG